MTHVDVVRVSVLDTEAGDAVPREAVAWEPRTTLGVLAVPVRLEAREASALSELNQGAEWGE